MHRHFGLSPNLGIITSATIISGTDSLNNLSPMVRKSFFNNNLSLTLYATDLLNNYHDRATMYSGDIKTYIFDRFESRAIKVQVQRYPFKISWHGCR